MKFSPRWTLTIRSQFVLWFLVIALVPLAGMGFLTYRTAKEGLQSQALIGLNNIASATHGVLFVSLNEKVGRTVDSSFDPKIKEFLALEENEKDALAQNTLNGSLAAQLETDPYITEIYLIDRRGIIAASSQPIAVGTNLSEDLIFKERKDTRPLEEKVEQPDILDVRLKNGKAVFTITFAVAEDGTRKFLGLVARDYSVDFLNAVVLGALQKRIGSVGVTRVGATGEAIIVNQNKTLITDARFEADTVLKRKSDTESVWSCIEKDQDQEIAEVDYRGVKTATSSKCLSFRDLRWTVIVKQDLEEIFSPVTALLKRVGLISMGSLILVVIFGVAASISISRQIGDPLKDIISKEKDLSQLKSKFIKTASHQFRTPLNSIRWNIEMMLSGDLAKLPVELEGLARVTYKSNQIIMHTLEDLLLALDIEERALTLEKEPTSIENVVNTAILALKSDMEVKKLAFNLEKPEGGASPKQVEIDKAKIGKVIYALLDNAIKYTKEGGKVTAKLVGEGKTVKFIVEDTGVGIPKDDTPLLFTKFFRGSNAVSMYPDASGLGLFISKYLIEAHGGKISFTSEEGKGSAFWFELPC